MKQKSIKVFSILFCILHFAGSFLLWVYLVQAALQKAEITGLIKGGFYFSFVMWFPVSMLGIAGVVPLNASEMPFLLLINSCLWASLLYRLLKRAVLGP